MANTIPLVVPTDRMPSDTVRRRQVRRTLDIADPNEEIVQEVRRDERNRRQLTTRHWTAIVGFLLILTSYSVHLHKCLPEPLSPNEENTRFSEIRARRILTELSDFGPKPAGSEACERLTRNRIIQELSSIKESASTDVRFDIATQNPSGCFDIPKFDTEEFTICYRNVSNVIARLGKSEKKDGISILLNCHYDSWPTSSGGSDDLISCALMLELIRLLSHQSSKLQHDVIFLFNGAEESSLQAAHGFITQHPWRHSVRAFINLEASGSGGRELLFQAGPANQWLLNSYLEAAIHPHCSVLGQEVFQSGVYPGDTDYRVFRDYGRVPGLDLAFVQNGYWWHTEFDEAKRITEGSLQRAGENVYSTLCHLLASPYLEKPAEYGEQKSVFFDFIGLFVVVYPLRIAHAINIAIILTNIFIFLKGITTKGSLYVSAISNYVMVIFAMVTMTYIMVLASSKWLGVLSWYTYHWISVLVYGMPVFWVGAVTQTFLTSKLRPTEKEEHASAIENVHLLFISLILCVFTYYDIASGFLFAFMALPVFKKLVPTKDLDAWLLIVVHLFFCLPGICMSIYTSEMLLSIFIPIMGRNSSNPEPIVAAFVAFSAISIILLILPLLTRSRSVRDPSEAGFKDYIFMLIGVFMIVAVVLYVTSSAIGSPYRYTDEYPTTKRTQFFHTNRVFYNPDGSVKLNDSIIYAISQDYRGAEDIPFVNEENDFAPITCAYDDPYCEIPFYFPTRNRVQDRHIRFKYAVEKPILEAKSEIVVKSKKREGSTIHYELNVKGSGQISVYLVAQNNWKIANCSLSQPITEPADSLFLYLTCSGKKCGNWNFTLTMKTSSDLPGSPLLAGVASHFLHGPSMYSQTSLEIMRTIETQRQLNNYWAITTSAWNVDLIYQYL